MGLFPMACKYNYYVYMYVLFSLRQQYLGQYALVLFIVADIMMYLATCVIKAVHLI